MAAPHVLVIDDDPAIGAIVQEILEEEGLAVTLLRPPPAAAALRAAVARLEPDCVLLDGAGRGDYGPSWPAAAWLRARAQPVPVIMFSADRRATAEGRAGASARSQTAGFAAILDKPFDLDALVALVRAVLRRGAGPRFSRMALAEVR
jgi:two-component system response regulator MprA